MTQESITLNTTPPYSGADLVDDLNNALQSLGTDFAGSVDPASVDGVGPYVTWADTANNLLKRRNAAGTAWVVEGKLLVDNSNAGNIDYDNTASGLTAENVQEAVDELASEKLDADKNIVLGTPVTLSGQTAVDFTGIPATAKRVTLKFYEVSTSGVSSILIQAGPSSGVESAGYSGAGGYIVNGGATVINNYSQGFGFINPADTAVHTGSISLELVDADTNKWSASGVIPRGDNVAISFTGGNKSLTGELARIRLTTANGTDQFDAGTINISWE